MGQVAKTQRNIGAMGNKWKLSKSSKPQNQNYKLSIKSKPKTSNINKINQVLKPVKVLKTWPHLFNFILFLFIYFVCLFFCVIGVRIVVCFLLAMLDDVFWPWLMYIHILPNCWFIFQMLSNAIVHVKKTKKNEKKTKKK